MEVLLPAFAGMVRTMTFDRRRMAAQAGTGFALATDVAEWLVRHGVPFRRAHQLSGACVKLAESRGVELWDLTDADYVTAFHGFVDANTASKVREVLSVSGSVAARIGAGGTAPVRVAEQMAGARAALKPLQAFARSISDGPAYHRPGSS